MVRKTVTQMVSEAKARVENLSAATVGAKLEASDALLVDLREPEERRQHGRISGSIHAPRGMLEFYADPTGPYHRPELDPSRRTILYCASGSRSALAAELLQSLGYTRVAHLDGGLRAWQAAGLTIEPAS